MYVEGNRGFKKYYRIRLWKILFLSLSFFRVEAAKMTTNGKYEQNTRVVDTIVIEHVDSSEMLIHTPLKGPLIIVARKYVRS